MNFSFKNYKPGLVVSSIIAILGVHSLIFSKIEVPNWIPSISATSIIMLLFLLYDRFVWKRMPFLVNIKDVSGRYGGKIETSFDSSITMDVVIEICQTASSVFIRQYAKNGQANSSSFSTNESVRLLPDDSIEIGFSYRNNGIETSEDLRNHIGYCVLNISNDGIVEGYYFTNRTPQTKGIIKAARVSKKILSHY